MNHSGSAVSVLVNLREMLQRASVERYITGICYRCGARCLHSAWTGNDGKGLVCMDCGMPAEQREIAIDARKE
jgi:hypothetical protein